MKRDEIMDKAIVFVFYAFICVYGVIVVMPTCALTILKDKVNRFIHPPLYGLYRHGSEMSACWSPSCECEEKLLLLSYDGNDLIEKGREKFGRYFIEEVKYWKSTTISSQFQEQSTKLQSPLKQ